MKNRDLSPNLNQLKYFYIVAKTKSYTKAARELFLTEPAVHMQLRSLERSLGSKLLNRNGKELELTESGKVLYGYAEKVFHLIQEAVSKVTLLENLDGGYLRLGTVKALAQHFMPFIISSFHKRYPEIRIVLNEDNSYDVVDGIVNGRDDIGIVGRVPYPPLVNAIPFTELEMFIAVSPTSKLSQKKDISIYELVDEPLICRTTRAATRLRIEEAFKKRGLKPLVIVEVENVELIAKLVKQGEGYSVLSELCLQEETKTGKLVRLRLKEERILLDIDVIYKKDETLPITASAFLRFLQEGEANHSQFMRHV